MNFIDKVKDGQRGKNVGLSTGLKALDKTIDGIQRKAIYGIAAAPKVGKTTLTDSCFVIEPFLYYLNYMEHHPDSPLRIHWIYYSFEIDRVKKEMKYAAHFMARDYGVYNFMYNGRLYQMSQRYLEGKLTDENDLDEAGNPKVIKLLPEHLQMLKEIYTRRIIPLFGEYDTHGTKIRDGYIDFIEERENPTGLRNYIFKYANENGKFVTQKYNTLNEQGQTVTRERISGYNPNNSSLYTIIITDHVRKLKKERGFTMKENIDKWIEYQVELRNWCSFTFVDVVHLNRSLASIDRIKYLSEFLYPTGDDVKDTGNISEEADYLLTMFNPQDEKYGIKRHFKLDLEGYPNYRSIHLVESRDTECPAHLQVNMFGNINTFQSI